MRRLSFVILLLILLASFIPSASAQDCAPYINQVLGDAVTIDSAVRNANGQNSATIAASYWQIAQIRHRYEDQSLVPPCAIYLHSVMVQWMGAMQDKTALFLANAANPGLYTSQIQQIDSRLNLLAEAANIEIQRLQATSAVVVTPPPAPADWYRVYFTQPINSNDPAAHTGSRLEQSLIFMINNSTRSIEAALFELNAPDTTAALLRAAQRGIQIRLLVDDEHALNKPDSTIEELIRAGVQVKSDERSALMHSKFFVFDSTTVWTGSTNITRNGIYNNDNHAILIRSTELAANFQAEFEEMFTDGNFSRAQDSRATPYVQLTLGNSLIETYFSPEDGRSIEQRLVELSRSAQSSIRVMAFSFTLKPVGDAMLESFQRGVQVEGVFETVGSSTGQMPRLTCAGMAIRRDGNPSIMHHKVFIFDEEVVVLGSFNFSSNARDRNTENVLIIHDRAIAAEFTQEFRRVFSLGNPPPVQC